MSLCDPPDLVHGGSRHSCHHRHSLHDEQPERDVLHQVAVLEIRHVLPVLRFVCRVRQALQHQLMHEKNHEYETHLSPK